MEPDYLRDDLKQEVITIVCGWPDEKVLSLHSGRLLEFTVVRVILNQIQSNTSPFFKKYRQITKEITEMKDHPIEEINEIIERNEREVIEDIALAEIDNLYWYKAEMIKLYKKHGNYRAIEAETKIPYISCYKNIKQSFEELRQKAISKSV